MATNEQGSGMATNEQTHEGRGLLDLAVCYLVFHVFGSAVVLALLTSSTLAYVGASEVSAELAPTVTVLGAELPVRVLLIVLWVAAAAVAVAGVAFGISALLARVREERLGRAIVLGRVMFGLALVNAVLSFVQTAPVALVWGIASAGLTGALALELRKLERVLRSEGHDLSTPRKSFVVDAAEEIPRLEESCEKDMRPLFRLCSGYASIMLAWGCLRLLMGLTTLFAAPVATPSPVRVPVTVHGTLTIVAGAYLIFVGRLGKRALAGRSGLLRLVEASLVGLVASAGTLVVYGVWLALGWTADGLLVFCVLADCLLYAAGIYYASKLRKGFEKKS